MGWSFGARKKLNFGPFYVNLTDKGSVSFGIKVGRFSRNFTRGTTHIDTPGPGGFTHRPRKRGRR